MTVNTSQNYCFSSLFFFLLLLFSYRFFEKKNYLLLIRTIYLINYGKIYKAKRMFVITLLTEKMPPGKTEKIFNKNNNSLRSSDDKSPTSSKNKRFSQFV